MSKDKNKKINNTKGDLAKALLELKNNKNAKLDDIIDLIASQEDFLKGLALQNSKAVFRQLLRTSHDFYGSKDAINSAFEAGAISEEIKTTLLENYLNISEDFNSKIKAIENIMTSPGNVKGYLNKISKGIDNYTTWVKKQTDDFKDIKNVISFDMDLPDLPEHRESDLIFNLLVFDFYSNKEIEPIKKGDDVSSIKGLIPNSIAKNYDLDFKVSTTYDKQSKNLSVDINVIRPSTDENRIDVSLLINKQATQEAFVNAFKKQYLVNSSVIIEDFSDELKMIKTLYIDTMVTLFSAPLDANLSVVASLLQDTINDLRNILKDFRASEEVAKKKNPLLEGVLAIVEDGTESTLNKGEKIGRISQEEVEAKLFQGNHSRYEATISEDGPQQVGLDRRFSVFRFNSGDELIDFIIIEYGKTKQKFWAPINKTFIAPKELVSTWELLGSGNKKDIINGQLDNGETYETWISVSSDQINIKD